MTLGLCMIVKNESDVLARVLESAQAFADEIVVVDTGSTDGTADVALRYTDKVYSFEWRDDFAAARNFALSKVTSDYWIWLDADDVVPPKTAKGIAKFMRGTDGSVDAVMLPYVLGIDEKGKPTFSYFRERIIKNNRSMLWRGRVHEAVAVHGNVVCLPYIVLHEKPQGRSSGTRNLDIYRKMISEGERLEPRELYYYARELYYNGYTEAAAERFAEFIAMPDGFAVNKADACLMLSRCHKKIGDLPAALSAAFSGFVFGLPSGEACCEIASLFFTLKDYRASAYWYERAARSKPDISSGAFVDGACYGFIPFVWLSVCYDRLGDMKKAYRYHCRARKIAPNHPSVIANEGYFSQFGFS